MTNTAIQATMHMHGVTSMATADNKVLALDQYTFEGMLFGTWVDVTGYTDRALRNFLGYDNVEDINYN